MYIRFICGCVMAGLLLCSAGTGPVFSQKKDDNKDDRPPAAQGTPADYQALLQSREVVGKLSSVEGTKQLKFEIEYYVPAGGGGNNNPLQALAGQAQKQQQYQLQMAKLLQQQQQASQQQSKNPQQQRQKMAQIAAQIQKLQMQQAMGGGGQKAGGGQPNLKAAYKEFEADLDPKVVVRRNFLIYDYDDKGYAKQYTQAEIAALRGKDSSKPGYIAKFEDLQAGAVVKLYLSNSGAPEPKKKDGKKDAKADSKKNDDEGVGNVTRPTVTMVLILADPPMNPNMPTKEMPKKKN